eukprot:gnl/TRDRNA2_/TRDRNA2_136425_c0_seq3.p1 gnl/TRDRNA2_/TRDRNA2_136425_c0~~gnl/TRDRNA2_/TRDRNA2_136425_c0_seq3.p1  ORF type:complete len:351 (-),score=89.74 gnl/TRDRNA2_/TRDRNA2_136425_c0_seq3:229-1281(-)
MAGAAPYPILDPDDPAFKGKKWEDVEAELNKRDKFMLATSGFDTESTEHTGPSTANPGRAYVATFPWEEKVEPFERPAGCTQKNWSHTVLKYKIGDGIATLTMEKQNNTLDPGMLDALQDAIMDLEGQKDVRVVCLKGEGKVFSSGFDPKFFMSESTMSEKEIVKVQLQFARILYYFQRLPQWTVALVHGSAMGASIGLLCACDFVVAVKGAFFGMTEAKLGLVPSVSIPYIMKRISAMANTRQLILAAVNFSAENAKEYGLIDEVVEDADGLKAELKKVCDRLALCAPGAVAATKKVVINLPGQPPSSFLLNYVAGVVAEVRNGSEAKAGIESIQSKKKPVWADKPIMP